MIEHRRLNSLGNISGTQLVASTGWRVVLMPMALNHISGAILAEPHDADFG